MAAGSDRRRVRALCVGSHRTSSDPEGSSDKVFDRAPQLQPEPFADRFPSADLE